MPWHLLLSHGNSDTSCVQITCHSKGNCITLVIVNFVFITYVKISNFRAKAHLVFHWCLYNKRT